MFTNFDHPYAELSVDGQVVPRANVSISGSETYFESLGAVQDAINEPLLDEEQHQ